jgi:ELWxxDGT repeat protein
MVSAGTQLFFTAGAFFDEALWRSDGTRAGTRRVVEPCPECSSQIQRSLTPLADGRVFFTARSLQNGVELWVSDGTPAGTRSLDIFPGVQGSSPESLIALGNRLLFWTYDFPSSRYDLRVSDGTLAGTQVVQANLLVPSFESGPVVWKGAVYFANNFGEFWRTDGTPGGTILLRTFETIQNGPPYFTSSSPTRLTPLRNDLLFIAADPARGLALWRTRGTPETTRPLRDPVPGPESPDLAGLQSVGNRAFFFARRAEGPFDLWVSDGRTAGTRQVITLCHTAAECLSPDRYDLASAGGLAFFAVHSKIVGSELWRSDGSAQGTFQVRDISSGAGSSVLGDIAALEDRALFAALTTSPFAGPATLWSSDGTAAGTVSVHDEAPWPQDFLRQGDHLYFSGALPRSISAPFSLQRQGLWRTDGTPAGTEHLASNLFDLDLLALDGDLLYLGARDDQFLAGGTGVELWQSDGTQGGTRQVVDIDQQGEVVIGSPSYLAPGSSHPGPLVRLGAALLLAADDGLTGRELWATDGTEAGTREVRNINPQYLGDDSSGDIRPAGSDPDFLVRLGGVVLFTADDGLTGRELWVTDGTEAGTRQLRDLRPGAEGSQPHDLVAFGGAVYFFASAGGPGEALWRTDGTAAGTVQVRNLSRQGLPSWGRALTLAGNRLFFVADNEAIGSELHVSDGTQAGTRLVRQIRAGANGSYPQSFTAVDGVLVFAADDGAHGLEPWRSDGTAAGTRRLGDLAPGQAAAAPTAFTAAGGLLFFAADDGVHGRELWTMELP